MRDIIIYSTFHKPFITPNADYIIPIQAGTVSAANKMDMQGDDTGDNISYLNKFFAELTVVYWVVKNAKRNCSAWGICHYRRYFMLQHTSFLRKKKSGYSFHPTQKTIDELINGQLYHQIKELLVVNDAIVQQPELIDRRNGIIKNLEENYLSGHVPEHWKILKEVVFEKYPDYEVSWQPFCSSLKMSFGNMMIAKWKIWDEYTSWLFDILFEVHKRIAFYTDTYQERAVAFMAERLMNLFIMHNKIKTGFLPLAILDKK